MKRRISNLASILLEQRSWVVMLFQAALILFSLVLAWLLRFDFSWGHQGLLWASAPVLIGIRLASMRIFGLHHGWWRYTGVSDAVDIAKSVAVGSLAFFLLLRFGFGLNSFPRSIYILEAILTAGLLMGVRILSRALAESVREDWASARRVLILGAGFAAQMILRELSSPGSKYKAVGCVDDDPSKVGARILGVPVLGNVQDIPRLVEQHLVAEILIAVPSATNEQMRRFVEVCERSGASFKTVPALRDFIAGKETVRQLREVNLEDLLGREPVVIDLQSVRAQIEGRSVLVTGAAGSIGSEICRQVLSFNPARLVCLDQSETGIFYLNMDLSDRRGITQVVTIVGDVGDLFQMHEIIMDHQVSVIFHAAAYKHVPVMESNVHAAVRNNVFALLQLLDTAEASGCEAFILISSDKAVNPTSVMGATKRIGELILASRPSSMRCVAVRFGNVLGSNGSLIPILQEKLRNNDPLPITHPEIRRFFMTTAEAVSLVLQAFVIGKHRDILVLDMGESLKVLDIAKTLIALSGKSESQVQFVFTGLRDGEKFYEELFYESERVLPSEFEKIKRTHGKIADWKVLQQALRGLQEGFQGDEQDVRAAIKLIVPEYTWTPDAPLGFQEGQKARAAVNSGD